jgi:hypothetical protein
VHKHCASDMRAIRDIVLAKMQDHFYPSLSTAEGEDVALSKKAWRDREDEADLPLDDIDEEGSAETEESGMLSLASAEAKLLKQKSDEVMRLKARVAELEADLAKRKRGSFFHRS